MAVSNESRDDGLPAPLAAARAPSASVLTTDAVPLHQRLDYWQTVCSEILGTIECRDFKAEGFEASLDLTKVDDIQIGHFKGVDQTLDRKRSHLKQSDTDDYIVVLESDNIFSYDHNGHQRSGRNGIVLLDIAKPYFSNHSKRLEVTDLFIPRRKIEDILGQTHMAAGLCIEPTQACAPILSAFLRSFAAHGAMLDHASAARMSNIAVDMIAFGFAERMALQPLQSLSGASILYRAKAHIEANLGRSGLTISEIAAAVAVSVRRLHQIAKEEGISLGDWIWERRLLHARNLLSDAGYRSQQASTIAYICGFSSQQHFSRRFKDRFGQTPSEFRTQTLSHKPQDP